MKIRKIWPYALLLAVGLAILLPRLGDFGLWDPWEPKYAQSAREMLERDSYIIPYYRDNVRMAKPILTYWGVIAGSVVFGLNEFGARIGGVLMAVGSLLGVFYATSLLRGRRAGLYAALVLATVPQFYFIARQAIPDIYLLTTLGSSLLFFALGVFGPDRRRDLHLAVSYVCFALAILAKGPFVCVPLFFAPLGLCALAAIDFRTFWRPDMRRESIRFLTVAGTASGLALILGLAAVLFGVPVEWLGYSKSTLMNAALQRGKLESSITGAHLMDVGLVLIALGTAAGALMMFRRGRSLAVMAMCAAPALAAVTALVTLDAKMRIVAFCVLGFGAGALVVAQATRRLLRQPALQASVGPWVRPVLRQCAVFTGIVVGLALPWYLAAIYLEGRDFFGDFVVYNNLRRAGSEINQSGSFDFYLRTLAFGYFPWSCLVPVAIGGLITRFGRRSWQRYGPEMYMLVATVGILVLFGSAKTKFAHYLAPAAIPLAFLIGLFLDKLMRMRNGAFTRLAWGVAGMLFLMPMIDLTRDGGYKYLVGTFTIKRAVPASIEPGTGITVLLAVVAGILFLSVLRQSRWLVGALFLSAGIFASYNTAVFIPALTQYKSMKQLCESWKRYRVGDAPLGLYGAMKHGTIFYSNHTVKIVDDREEFDEFMNPAREAFCIVERKRFKDIRLFYRRQFPGKDLYTLNDSHLSYTLVSNHPVRSGSGSGSD